MAITAMITPPPRTHRRLLFFLGAEIRWSSGTVAFNVSAVISGDTTVVVAAECGYWRKESFKPTRTGSLNVSLIAAGRFPTLTRETFRIANSRWQIRLVYSMNSRPDGFAICYMLFAILDCRPIQLPSANRGNAGISLLFGSGAVSVAFRPPVASSQSAI